MNELQVFSSNEFGSVRTLVINDDPWFVGKDVAEILGYRNLNEAIQDHVDDDDKLNSKMLSSFDIQLGQRGGWLINESGLYSLILSSKMPKAKEFKRWVTSEVLPAIRKHGVYATDNMIDRMLANPDAMIAALTELKAERERSRALQETVAVQKQQISEMKPKASYYDMVLNCKDLVSTSVIAKDYGWSALRMNDYLHDKGVQYKQGKTWLLYQKYAEMGYTNTKTHTYPSNDGAIHTSVHMYWTQVGRLFIYDLLKSDGILPTIERAAIVHDGEMQ